MNQAEATASATLARVPGWIWDGETLPVPIEDIAESWFSLHIREVDDLSTAPGCPALAEGQSLSGLLLPARGEIWVNESEAREWPGRRRFTIAHELGHWRMHRTGQQSLFCRKTSVAEGDTALDGRARSQTAAKAAQDKPPDTAVEPATTRPPLPPSEEEANEFAAAILMPAELIEHHYVEDRDFQRLCKLFGSSGAAMSRRLRAVI